MRINFILYDMHMKNTWKKAVLGLAGLLAVAGVATYAAEPTTVSDNWESLKPHTSISFNYEQKRGGMKNPHIQFPELNNESFTDEERADLFAELKWFDNDGNVPAEASQGWGMREFRAQKDAEIWDSSEDHDTYVAKSWNFGWMKGKARNPRVETTTEE